MVDRDDDINPAAAAITRFVTLRGSGRYDPSTMMEAALLLEELTGQVLSDDQLCEANLGDAGGLESFARALPYNG